MNFLNFIFHLAKQLRKLISTGWDYDRTAQELGISEATLFNKPRAYRMKRPRSFHRREKTFDVLTFILFSS